MLKHTNIWMRANADGEWFPIDGYHYDASELDIAVDPDSLANALKNANDAKKFLDNSFIVNNYKTDLSSNTEISIPSPKSSDNIKNIGITGILGRNNGGTGVAGDTGQEVLSKMLETEDGIVYPNGYMERLHVGTLVGGIEIEQNEFPSIAATDADIVNLNVENMRGSKLTLNTNYDIYSTQKPKNVQFSNDYLISKFYGNSDSNNDVIAPKINIYGYNEDGEQARNVSFAIGTDLKNAGLYDHDNHKWIIYSKNNDENSSLDYNVTYIPDRVELSDGTQSSYIQAPIKHISKQEQSSLINASTIIEDDTDLCNFSQYDKDKNCTFYSAIRMYGKNKSSNPGRLYKSYVLQRVQKNSAGETEKTYYNGFYLNIEKDGTQSVSFTPSGGQPWRDGLKLQNDMIMAVGGRKYTYNTSTKTGSWSNFPVGFGTNYNTPGDGSTTENAPGTGDTTYNTRTSGLCPLHSSESFGRAKKYDSLPSRVTDGNVFGVMASRTENSIANLKETATNGNYYGVRIGNDFVGGKKVLVSANVRLTNLTVGATYAARISFINSKREDNGSKTVNGVTTKYYKRTHVSSAADGCTVCFKASSDTESFVIPPAIVSVDAPYSPDVYGRAITIQAWQVGVTSGQQKGYFDAGKTSLTIQYLG